MTTDESERLLMPEEVADRLGLSIHTAKAWMRRGILPGSFKLGERGLLRIREADLDRYIRETAKAEATAAKREAQP